MADQPDNAWKATHHGAGLAISRMFDVTEGPLYEGIMRVLSEPSFRENAQKLSKRMRSRKRLGSEEAAGMRHRRVFCFCFGNSLDSFLELYHRRCVLLFFILHPAMYAHAPAHAAHAHAHTHGHPHACTHTHTHTHSPCSMHCTSTHTHTHTHTHARAHACMHTHTHTHTCCMLILQM
jgi:hypothetical protein